MHKGPIEIAQAEPGKSSQLPVGLINFVGAGTLAETWN
jgi:hypothetical protein